WFGSNLPADHLECGRAALPGLRRRLAGSAVADASLGTADNLRRELRSAATMPIAGVGHGPGDDRAARRRRASGASRASAVRALVVVARDTPSRRLGRARFDHGSVGLGV